MTSARESYDGCHYVVTGVANEWSLAWSVVRHLARGGGICHVACLPAHERRVSRLLRDEGFSSAQLYPLDVRVPESLASVSRGVASHTSHVSGVLHSIAYADGEELQAGVLGTTKDGFVTAMEVSVFSLLSLCQALEPLLARGSSVVTMTYHGAQKCMPGYGIMGVAKAALESLVRYLASELGPKGVRANAVSAGPVLTLAASVFPDIEAKIHRAAEIAPLRRPTTQDEVAAMVAYLFSSDSRAVTGQCLYVDGGLGIMGAA
jgi:enoyl-[acyl-carrier protein] reductase I